MLAPAFDIESVTLVARKIGAFGLPNTEILEGEQHGLIKDLRAGPISIFIFCAVVNQHSGILISLHLFSQSLTNFVYGPFQKREDVRPTPNSAYHRRPPRRAEINKNRNGRV
ncbi:hypothetical protein G9X68_05205 [Rhizobium sp. WYCCWR 11279]|uniref:hypothetical protein n=1 Tax=Rhizobium changzhiense TaxID=2692317 RepID=UPI001492A18E|nr:hypothetical protein [Rhizobium changzhiense]NNU46522.1 hypothetical protein [Rhizobium changzhiense]